jgi:ABC-type Na+ transport system ATPase subunit NatA
MAIIHHGRVLAQGTLAELRQESGMHYLEDIFLSVVKDTGDEIEDS